MKFFALNVLTIKCEKLEVFFYNINMTIEEKIKNREEFFNDVE